MIGLIGESVGIIVGQIGEPAKLFIPTEYIQGSTAENIWVPLYWKNKIQWGCGEVGTACWILWLVHMPVGLVQEQLSYR